MNENLDIIVEKNRYEGRTARLAAKKYLNENCNLEYIQKLLNCKDLDEAENIIKNMQKISYMTVLPKGIALCWGCSKCLCSKECSWSSKLQPREDWTSESIIKRKDKIDGEMICVRKCKGFELGDTRIERKYIISILHDFYSMYDQDLFTVKFFNKCENKILLEWLELYNNYIELLDFSPLELLENDFDDFDDKEDLSEEELNTILNY